MCIKSVCKRVLFVDSQFADGVARYGFLQKYFAQSFSAVSLGDEQHLKGRPLYSHKGDGLLLFMLRCNQKRHLLESLRYVLFEHLNGIFR